MTDTREGGGAKSSSRRRRGTVPAEPPSRKPIWQRVRDEVHRRDIYVALAFTILTLLISAVLFPSDYGALGYRHSIIKVFDAKSLPDDLRLVDKQDQPIVTDVYAVETTLANTGTIAFEQSRIRRPIEIKFDDAKIIQTRIGSAVDGDVSRFVAERADDKTVRLAWASFDPGQYVKVTTLVTASMPIEPQIVGSIFGVKISPGRKASPLGPFETPFVLVLGSLSVLGFGAIGTFIIVDVLRTLVREGRAVTLKLSLQMLVASALGIFFVWLSIWFAYRGFINLQKPMMPL